MARLRHADAVKRMYALFPLTAALSLRERGWRSPSLEVPERLGISKRGAWFTLSPRERAGVRGKGMLNLPGRGSFAVVLRVWVSIGEGFSSC
jgi:hypothetical protein